VKVLAEVAPAMLLNYPSSQAGLLVYGGITPPASLPTDVAVYALAADGFVGSGIGPSRGVVGNGGSGIGVQGLTAGGIGVDARATTTTGTALRTTGKVQFNRSGRTSITAGHASRTVSMAGVTTSSYIIATPQTNRAGIYIQSVVPAAGKFTIYLNKAVTGTSYIGYLVIN
jgi:hypothetical protein